MECRTSAWTSGRHHIKCTQKLLSFNASKNVKELFLKFQPITVFLNLRKRAHKHVIYDFLFPILFFLFHAGFHILRSKLRTSEVLLLDCRAKQIKILQILIVFTRKLLTKYTILSKNNYRSLFN